MEKIDLFKRLGFTDYESKTLNSFLKLKLASPKEISIDSNVPQNKLYKIIKNIEKLGILARIPSEEKKYQLINFETFIEEKIKQKDNELKQLKYASKSIQNPILDEEQFNFSLIRGQKAIMNKLAEKNQKVKKEILGVQRNWKIWGEGLRQMQSAIKKGVKVKMIGIINNETGKRAIEWKETGVIIKKYNKKFGEFPLRYSIFDNKELRITIGKPEIKKPEDYVTIWTNSKPLISLLRKQFKEMWKECESF